MPLQNYQYDTIMREYNRRQAQNRRIQEEHQREAYEKIPRLREIDEEVATFDAEDVYNQKDAEGFINLFGLPIHVKAVLDQKRNNK